MVVDQGAAAVDRELEEVDGGTRMTVVSRFATAEELQQVLDMGMAEGMTAAVGQMDSLLVHA